MYKDSLISVTYESPDPAANPHFVYYRVQNISYINSLNTGTKENQEIKQFWFYKMYTQLKNILIL